MGALYIVCNDHEIFKLKASPSNKPNIEPDEFIVSFMTCKNIVSVAPVVKNVLEHAFNENGEFKGDIYEIQKVFIETVERSNNILSVMYT